MNAQVAPRRKRIPRYLLLVLILIAGVGAWRDVRVLAAPASKTILIENRTYTPLWYRTQGGGGYGKWTALLPGERHAFHRWATLRVETSLVGGVKKFTLAGGNTYYYGRRDQKGAANFRTDAADRARGAWRRLMPPKMEYYTANANNAFAPLMKFMDEADRYGDEYKLSLRDFAVECYDAQQEGGKLPHDLRYMKGFTWFFGYIIDRAKNDVILLGLKDPTHPPLDVDCLATAIKAVHEGRMPACSLENKPGAKHQTTVIDGIPWNTRWAQVMIDADYLMKKLSLGVEKSRIPGLNSKWYYEYWWRRRQLEAMYSEGSFKAGSTDRWWFNFDNNAERALASPAGDLVVLYRNPVRLSTEQQVDGAFGSGQTTSYSVDFADDFSREMETAGLHYPSVGELLSLFRLYDLFLHLRTVGQVGPPGLGYWTDHYQHPYAGPPAGMPTITRNVTYRWNSDGWKYTVPMGYEGGVLMKLAVDEATLRHSQAMPDGVLERLLTASPR